MQLESYCSDYHQQWQNSGRSNNIKIKQQKKLTKLATHKLIQQNDFENTYNVPIAIVGMGVEVPGSNSTKEFHNNLLMNKSFNQKPPDHRFSDWWVKKSKQWLKEKNIKETSLGGYLPIPKFEGKNPLKIAPKDLIDVDPNQIRLYTVAEQALKQAQMQKQESLLANTCLLTGVMMDSEFFGREHSSLRFYCLIDDVLKLLKDKGVPEVIRQQIENQFLETSKDLVYHINQNSAVSGIDSVIGSRLAKNFNIRGGSYAFDAVCASGLLQIDHALKLLRSREKDAVLVCSSTMAMTTAVMDCYNSITGGWVNGTAKPFDKNRSSFTLGEGAAALVLRRLDDALKDGQKILALVHASGISCDGTSTQMLQPTKDTCKQAVLNAYHELGDFPPFVSHIETNGLGTPISDQVEMEIYSEVYTHPHRPPVTLSGLKGAIGHLKVSSALVNTVKATLGLQNRVIYPTCGLENEDPFLANNQLQIFKEANTSFTVPDDELRFTAVSSIGLGGINAHIILSETYKSAIEKPHKEENGPSATSPLSLTGRTYPAKLIDGSPLLRGQKLGDQWRLNYQNKFGEFLKLFPQAEQMQNFVFDLEGFKKWIPSIYLEELQGFAQASETPFEKVIWIHGFLNTLITDFGACCGFVLPLTNGAVVHGGSLDIPFVNQKSNDLLTRSICEFKTETNIKFISLSILGCLFPFAGLNEKGISVSVSTGSKNSKTLSDGRAIFFVVRQILETAENFEQAIQCIRSAPISGAWIILLNSDTDHQSAMIEVNGTNVDISFNNKLTTTNHFQLLENENPREDSILRLKRLQELAQNSFEEMSDLLMILEDQFDLQRNRQTKNATANTLNRYNSGLSFLFRIDFKQAFVSYKEMPSGKGPFYGFQFSDNSCANQHQASTHQGLIPQLVSWQEVLGTSNDSLPFQPINKSELTLIFWRRLEDLDIEIITKENFVLIDCLGYELDLAKSLKIFEKKVSWFRAHPEITHRIIQLHLWGLDEEVTLRSKSQNISSLFSMSRAFYLSLLKELELEKNIQFDFYALRSHFAFNETTYSKAILLNTEYKDWFVSYKRCFPILKIPSQIEFEPHAQPMQKENFHPSVYLLTGGLGGIAFEVIQKLAEINKLNQFIVIGKTRLEPNLPAKNKEEFFKAELKANPTLKIKDLATQWEKLEKANRYYHKVTQIQSADIKLSYLPCDLLNTQEIQSCLLQIKQNWPRIDCIIHSAGIDHSKLFQNKTHEQFQTVLNTKTTASLEFFEGISQYLNTDNIQKIFLFSSISAEIGNIGQTDYAAANSFYKGLAVQLGQKFINAKIRNLLWPAWAQIGMATHSAESSLRERGFKFLEPQWGINYIIKSLQSDENNFYDIITKELEDFSTRDACFVKNNTVVTDLQMLDNNKEQFLFCKQTRGLEKVFREHWIDHIPTLPGVFWLEGISEAFAMKNSDGTILIDNIEFIKPFKNLDCSNQNLYFSFNKINPRSWFFTGEAAQTNNKGNLLCPNDIFTKGTISINGSKSNQKLSLSKLETIQWKCAHFIYDTLANTFNGFLGPRFQVLKEIHIINDNELYLKAHKESQANFAFILDGVNQGLTAFPELQALTTFDYLPHAFKGTQISIANSNNSDFIIHLKKINFNPVILNYEASIFDSSTGYLVVKIENVLHRTTIKELQTGAFYETT